MVTALLVSIGAATGISVFLAVLMVVADATIGNYGEVTITVNDEKEFTAQGGKPLLGTLAAQEIFIPSACGGRGSCGLCKVKVLEGAGQYLPTELPWISEEEQKENIRLSCQLKVKQDFKIEIPEELFNVKQFDAVVEKVRDLTYDIKEVTLRLNDPPEIEIAAGQYIQLEIPEYELTDEPVYRAYSVAGIPSDKNRHHLRTQVPPGRGGGHLQRSVRRFLSSRIGKRHHLHRRRLGNGADKIDTPRHGGEGDRQENPLLLRGTL
jgi:Na+-transporting NADH:ubiquinone oxidoreductase subunit F